QPPRGGAVLRLAQPDPGRVCLQGRQLPGRGPAAELHPADRRPRCQPVRERDRKSTRLNSSHVKMSYAVFCLKKKGHKDHVVDIPVCHYNSPASGHLPTVLSFPTRRSSDLSTSSRRGGTTARPTRPGTSVSSRTAAPRAWTRCRTTPRRSATSVPTGPRTRSEEHTSELQSRENVVCRLLLEKKRAQRSCS